MKQLSSIGLIIATLLCLVSQKNVQAAPGTPGSIEFGYGAWLHLDGNYFQEGLNAVGELQLDWIAIDLNLSQWLPGSTVKPDYTTLDQAMQSADAIRTAVMLRLSNPPAWMITPQGPSGEAAVQLILNLAARYPGVLLAVELFPGANTTGGWKAAPDPAAYARLYTDVKTALQSNGMNLMLVAGGLRPIAQTIPGGDWNDLDFLGGLYTNGAAQWMDVLSLQLARLTGNPLKPSGSGNATVLRHYEVVRQVMLENNHNSGLIWITQLCIPDGTIIDGDKPYRDPQLQAEWLQQAAIQIRSQLYIGVVFIQNINPASQWSADFGKTALILNPQTFHPFYSVLRAIIQQTHPDQFSTDSGRPKSNSLLKCKYKT